jgi:hypothetical protein
VRRLRALPVALLLALVLAGCGDDARDVVGETARNLGDIRSGRLEMALRVGGSGPQASGGDLGFELSGPFALPARGGLPRADVDYTQLAGTRQATVTLVSTGDAAFVEVGGKAYELPPDQAESLRIGTEGLGSGGAGRQIRVGTWVRDPKLSDGGDVGGAETDLVSGRLDVTAAATDLVRLSRALGPDGAEELRALEQGGDKLEQAVESSSFDLWTGKDDRLLRRLRIAVRLGVGGGPSASVRFELGVADPNEPVRVEAPENPLPASALPGG